MARDEQPPSGRPRDPQIETAILEATRRRLVTDGYNGMSLADIASDAGTSRPALYRRWSNKLDLVIDALIYGYRLEQEYLAGTAPRAHSPFDRFREAVRRLDPRVFNPQAMQLQGGVIAESERNPQLLEAMQRYGIGPRCADFVDTVSALRAEGHIRGDVDLDLLATMVTGSYFAQFLRHGPAETPAFVDELANLNWTLIRTAAP